MTTKDQIEAAERWAEEDWANYEAFWIAKSAGTLVDNGHDGPFVKINVLTDPQLSALKEQWQREAWLESSKAGGCHACLDNWIREQK